jgi:hypothetical protein
MLIAEILYWNYDPAERDRSDLQLDLPPVPFGDDLSKLANAFTRRGLVKQLWSLNGWEDQPSGSAPPNAGTESIPRTTLEPTTAWQAEPFDDKPAVGQHRRGNAMTMWGAANRRPDGSSGRRLPPYTERRTQP